MRKNTPIRECMSRLPQEAERHDSLITTVTRMCEQRTHHVPVMDGSHVFGILSSYDLQVLAGSNSELGDLAAGDVCTQDPLTVGPMTPVFEVAKAMVERKVGSALVTDGGVLVGIFTNTDALRMIAAL